LFGSEAWKGAVLKSPLDGCVTALAMVPGYDQVFSTYRAFIKGWLHSKNLAIKKIVFDSIPGIYF